MFLYIALVDMVPELNETVDQVSSSRQKQTLDFTHEWWQEIPNLFFNRTNTRLSPVIREYVFYIL